MWGVGVTIELSRKEWHDLILIFLKSYLRWYEQIKDTRAPTINCPNDSAGTTRLSSQIQVNCIGKASRISYKMFVSLESTGHRLQKNLRPRKPELPSNKMKTAVWEKTQRSFFILYEPIKTEWRRLVTIWIEVYGIWREGHEDTKWSKKEHKE